MRNQHEKSACAIGVIDFRKVYEWTGLKIHVIIKLLPVQI